MSIEWYEMIARRSGGYQSNALFTGMEKRSLRLGRSVNRQIPSDFPVSDNEEVNRNVE